MQHRKWPFMLSIALLLATSAGAQDANQDLSLHFAKNRTITNSIVLFDYKEPVSIRIVEGMGGGDVSRPFLPALLCDDSIRFGASLDCYQARAGKDIFWDNPRVDIVQLSYDRRAVIFSADLNYSGSGGNLLWSLLVLNHEGIWKNLLPEVTTSNQSDHLFWHEDNLSKVGFLSLADFIWGEGEDHYGAHRYTIKTYEFCPNTGKYALADEFATSKKFEPVDAPQPYVVVGPMLSEIQRRLREKTAQACGRISAAPK